MFENIRQTLHDIATGAIPASQRGAAFAHMKATLVQAKVGVADIEAALNKSRTLLEVEERELVTVRRRKSQAEAIGDRETVDVAVRFETKHSERAEILKRKIAVQEDELRLAQAEIEGMTAALKLAAAETGGEYAPPRTSPADAEVDELLHGSENLRRDIDGLARQKVRESREADAERRLAELKKKMTE